MTTVIAENKCSLLMALADNELPDGERQTIESQLSQDPELRSEFEKFQRLNSLLLRTPPFPTPNPRPEQWNAYYRGVCRKMESRASWVYWVGSAMASALAGSLLIGSFPNNALAVGLGISCLVAGGGLLWMSYYCNCGK